MESLLGVSRRADFATLPRNLFSLDLTPLTSHLTSHDMSSTITCYPEHTAHNGIASCSPLCMRRSA